MPCIGLYSLGVELTGLCHGVMVNGLFEHDGQQGCPQGQHAWCSEVAALSPEDDLGEPAVFDADGYSE